MIIYFLFFLMKEVLFFTSRSIFLINIVLSKGSGAVGGSVTIEVMTRLDKESVQNSKDKERH